MVLQSFNYRLEGSNGTMKVYKQQHKRLFFIVMEKLGTNLQRFLQYFSGTISLQTIVNIGVQLINRFQSLHQTGFAYNNINGSNIYIGRR